MLRLFAEVVTHPALPASKVDLYKSQASCFFRVADFAASRKTCFESCARRSAVPAWWPPAPLAAPLCPLRMRPLPAGSPPTLLPSSPFRCSPSFLADTEHHRAPERQPAEHPGAGTGQAGLRQGVGVCQAPHPGAGLCAPAAPVRSAVHARPAWTLPSTRQPY